MNEKEFKAWGERHRQQLMQGFWPMDEGVQTPLPPPPGFVRSDDPECCPWCLYDYSRHKRYLREATRDANDS